MKDLFSTQSDLYARYRPVYPKELYDYILTFVGQREAAWDCATGNGQVARSLVGYFQRVYATDISANQLSHAPRLDRIEYSICSAERSPFSDNSFDLVTVAQAFHWLDDAAFCREAARVARPDAVVAVWGYQFAGVAAEIDGILHHWNNETLSPYWEPERRHVVSHYETLAFNFSDIRLANFQIAVDWDLEHMIGHLHTWSALKNMRRKAGDGAFRKVLEDLRAAWGTDGEKECHFSVFLKLGRVKK